MYGHKLGYNDTLIYQLIKQSTNSFITLIQNTDASNSELELEKTMN